MRNGPSVQHIHRSLLLNRCATTNSSLRIPLTVAPLDRYQGRSCSGTSAHCSAKCPVRAQRSRLWHEVMIGEIVLQANNDLRRSAPPLVGSLPPSSPSISSRTSSTILRSTAVSPGLWSLHSPVRRLYRPSRWFASLTLDERTEGGVSSGV